MQTRNTQQTTRGRLGYVFLQRALAVFECERVCVCVCVQIVFFALVYCAGDGFSLTRRQAPLCLVAS